MQWKTIFGWCAFIIFRAGKSRRTHFIASTANLCVCMIVLSHPEIIVTFRFVLFLGNYHTFIFHFVNGHSFYNIVFFSVHQIYFHFRSACSCSGCYCILLNSNHIFHAFLFALCYYSSFFLSFHFSTI